MRRNLRLMTRIVRLAVKLGWTIAVDDREDVRGLIIGTEEYVDEILEKK